MSLALQESLQTLPPTLMICSDIGPDDSLVLKPQSPLECRFKRQQRARVLDELDIAVLGTEIRIGLLNGNYQILPSEYPNREEIIARLNTSELKMDNLVNKLSQNKDLMMVDDQGNKWDLLPPSLKRNYESLSIQTFQELQEIGRSLPPLGERLSWSDRKKRDLNNKIARILFPLLDKIDREQQKKMFRGKTIAGYLNSEALPLAKGYRSWLMSYLPPQITQPLELSNPVQCARSLTDLVYLLGRQDGSYEIIDGAKEGELFLFKEKWEAGNMLDLIRLSTIADLARDPLEDLILQQFTQDVSDILPAEDGWKLFLDRSIDDNTIIRIRFSSQRDQSFLQIAGAKYSTNMDFTVRRFGPSDRDVVIFLQREKGSFSRMLKMMKNRPYPLTDYLGARFVVPDRFQLEKFVKSIKAKLPQWDIQPEEEPTSSPESKLPYNIKFIVKNRNYPNCPIELQIHFITEHLKERGSWCYLEFEPDKHPVAYRAKQVLAVVPRLVPREIYGKDWSDENLIKQVLTYANSTLFE